MTLHELELGKLLERFADGNPTPGGGSAAATAAALAASLVAMSARVTATNKKFADIAERMNRIAQDADSLREELTNLITTDSAAYDSVSSAYTMPKETDEQMAERSQAIQAAMKNAAEVPLSIMETTLEVLKLSAQVVERGNPNCITDAVSSCLLAEAGFESAMMNVCFNLKSINDEKYSKAMMERVIALKKKAATLINKVRMNYNSSQCDCETRKDS